MRRLGVMSVLCVAAGICVSAASTYEYKRELTKVDSQIDKKVAEIKEIEDLLFRIEQYKAENNIR